MIDINNRADIFSRLERLHPSATPAFGKFTPQHMVEHLSAVVMLSNGKEPAALTCPKADAFRMKKSLIYSDMDFPMEFKAPMMGNEPPPLELPDLKAAIEKLKTELDDFDRYFTENDSPRPVNPVLGSLTKEEWIVFHNKHFAHHFKQFNLL